MRCARLLKFKTQSGTERASFGNFPPEFAVFPCATARSWAWMSDIHEIEEFLRPLVPGKGQPCPRYKRATLLQTSGNAKRAAALEKGGKDYVFN